MKGGTAIIIGASSGIGLEIARLHARQGWRIAVAARRLDLLQEGFSADPQLAAMEALDVASPAGMEIFLRLAASLGQVDRIYFCSGMGEMNPSLEWANEGATIATNVTGFARLAGAAMQLFDRQGHGHLIGISSVAALRGAGEAPAYGASKAFMSRYLQALRFRAKATGLPIFVTDVRPGFVATAMMKADRPFWVASPEKAARQIIAAADRRARIAYISRRWALIGLLLKLLPE